MNGILRRLLASTGIFALFAIPALAQQSKSADLEALKAEIDTLKPAKLAWREIAWNPCLLDGLKESREQRKPVLLWIFIDRPADDARC